MIDLFSQALLSGFQVLSQSWSILLTVCLLSTIPFGLLVMLLVYKLNVTHDLAALFSAGLSGAVLFDLLLTYPLVLWLPAHVLRWPLISISILIYLLDIILWVSWDFKPRATPAFYALILILPLLLILKLSFISDLTLPLYTDSIEHYTIIQDLTLKSTPPRSYYSPADFPRVFYHYGYHILLSGQSALTRANLASLMLVHGQGLLVVAALGLYFPTFLATRSPLAALLAVLTSGLVCIMPAYAINWGKYPALTAFATLPLILGLLIHILQPGHRPPFRTLLLTLLAMLSCTLIHTRMLVVILICLMAIMTAFRLRLNARKLTLLCLALLAVLAALLCFKQPLLANLFGIYLRNSPLPLTLLWISAVFCAIHYPRLALGTLTALLIAILAVSIQMPGSLQRYEALLDRPFFQIGVSLPAAILAGSGMASLRHLLIKAHQPVWAAASVILFCLALLITAPWRSLLAPSDCCRLVDEEDRAAYQWLQTEAAATDRVLIAAVSASGALFEADGGAWIEPLTGISTEKALNKFDFYSPAQKELLCRQGIRWVYANDTRASFNPLALISNPQWYPQAFQSPRVSIFRVSCPPAP